jgi:predicted PurR-regulated permease PerM
VVILITSLYLMLWADRIRAFVLSLFAGETRAQVEAVGLEMVQVAGGYARGVGFNMLLVSTVTTIGLSLIGIPYALLLGIFAGIMETLPTIGSIIAAVPILVIALLQSPGTAIVTLVFVLAVQQIQGNLISPNVMKEQAHTPQFLVPLALIAGASVGGVLGALIAVPLLAMIRVLLLRVVAPFIRRQTGAAA